MLDAAALVDSSLDLSTDPAADRLVRFGSRALRRVLEPLSLRCQGTAEVAEPRSTSRRQESTKPTITYSSQGCDESGQGLRLEYLRAAPRPVRCSLMTLVRLTKATGGARGRHHRDEAQLPPRYSLSGTTLRERTPEG